MNRIRISKRRLRFNLLNGVAVSSEFARTVRQYFFVSLVLIVGLSFTWSATREAVRSSEREAYARFHAVAELMVERVRTQFQLGLGASQTLWAFDHVTEGDRRGRQDLFRRYVERNSALSSNRYIVALAHLEDKPNGRLVLAFDQNWAYSEGLQGRLDVLDSVTFEQLSFFLTGTPIDGTQMVVSLSSGLQETLSAPDGIMFVTSIKTRDGEPGLVLQVVDSAYFLEAALPDKRFEGLSIRLSKDYGGGHVQEITHLGGEISDPEQGRGLFEGLSQNVDVEIGSDVWTATVWSDPGVFRIDFGRAVITFSVCVILTGLVVFIVWTQSQRARRVVDMVERRTRALKQAHLELEEQNRLLRDLNTDLSSARKAAEAANRAKSEFLATVSHELRTPLNAILGFSQILGDQSLGEIGDPRYVEYAKDIHTSGAHLLGLINDILDLAKLEAGKLKIEKDMLAPVDLVEKVEQILDQSAQAKSIYLRSEVDTNLPAMVVGDMLRLRQVMLNLGSNAIKFTNQGGVIMRLLNRPFANGNPGWIMEVEDTGIGIPQEKLGTLFDRFTQVDAAHSRAHGGAGLGLAICRELVSRMHGQIHVRSSVNKGTLIWVHLPLEDVTAEMEEMESMII